MKLIVNRYLGFYFIILILLIILYFIAVSLYCVGLIIYWWYIKANIFFVYHSLFVFIFICILVTMACSAFLWSEMAYFTELYIPYNYEQVICVVPNSGQGVLGDEPVCGFVAFPKLRLCFLMSFSFICYY